MKYIALIGRIFFSIIFLTSGFFHFSPNTIGYASSMGAPMANILVPISGVIAIVGALSIILGYKAKWGAWLIVIFLIPVTLIMHKFWTITDPMMAQVQQAMFMKNISMLGGALLIAFFGAGPVSLDDRSNKVAS